MKKNWVLKESLDQEKVNKVAEQLNIEKTTAELIMNKNYSTPDEIYKFLNPELSNLHDPFLFKQMEKAVDRILKAVKSKEKILIYGDYDVDGTTGSALLYLVLKKLGASPEIYIPNRLNEGYGVTDKGMEYCLNSYVNLIITIDCGMGAAHRVRMLQEKGIDVIVVDHHEVGDEMVPAVAVLNSKIENYPFNGLAACGIAFKLVQGIAGKANLPEEEIWEYLDLVALATVCDVTPLVDENRIFVREGLKVLSRTKNIGLKKLIENSKLKQQKINTHHLGFILGPRINAKGRLGDAKETVNLFTTENREEANEIGNKIEWENTERQKIQAKIVEEAEKEVETIPDIIVLAKESWHPGIIGIAASKLAEKFCRPVILIAISGNNGRGSARSIPGFNIYDALQQCKELFLAFGGHKTAAGFSIEIKNIAPLKDRLNSIAASKLKVEDMTPKYIIDKKIELTNTNGKLMGELEKIEPFGYGNPRPLFLSTTVQVVGYPKFVKDNHIKFKIRDGNDMREAIGFGLKDLQVETGDFIDLIYELKKDDWGNNPKVAFYVKDIDNHGKTT